MKTWDGKTRYRFAHWKRDGHSLEVEWNGKELLCLTRKPQDITSQCRYLFDDFIQGSVPFHVSGELWIPGKKSSDVITYLKSQNPSLVFEVFVSHLHAPDDPLEYVKEGLRGTSLRFIPFETPSCSLVDFIMQPLPPDTEGYVFKNGNQLDWRKWKPTRTIDLIVSRLLHGKGKYAGTIGAIECRTAEGYVVTKCSGMTDGERDQIRVDRPIGKVVEVAFQYVGNGGRLRHPRFVRFRDDKRPEECTVDQDSELEEYWRVSD